MRGYRGLYPSAAAGGVARLWTLAFGFALATSTLWASPLSLTPCKVTSEMVRCGRLEVPEDWGRPKGRTLALNVIVMPKLGGGREQPPMLWLDGGPGVPGVDSAPLYATGLRFHRERRAVVLFDQRGTGKSAALHCPRIEAESPVGDLWPAEEVAACRRALAARADLEQYTTKAAARDVDALRAALGWDKIDLAALSYGTWLAQAYINLYPQRVRAAALFGTVPIGEKIPLHHAANGALALGQMFADCRTDQACQTAFPGLQGQWRALQARLARGPITIGTGPDALVVRQGPFNELVRSELNATPSLRGMPLLISRTAQGDFRPLLSRLEQHKSDLLAEGLYLSVTCPEATSRISPAEIGPAVETSDFGRWRIDRQIAACRLWSSSKPDARLMRPVKSDIPVLFLAGGRDATTPVFWARQVARGLPKSRVIVIEAMTHLPIGLTDMDCPDRIMDAFFAKDSVEGLDTSCIAAMRPPPFALG